MTLTELMALDPLQMSDKDLDAIIADLRQRRGQYNLGDKTAANPKKMKAAATAAGADLLASLGLIGAKK